jgi:ubiquinone/menaquinone biosynthesis C-methylase UbiE
MRTLVERLRTVEQLVEERFGVALEGRKMLDVGAGQRLLQMKYFAARNSVVGIDLDVIAQGFDPAGYVRMLRANGLKRTVKTIGRKLLGVDTRHSRELLKLGGGVRIPRLEVQHMDAAAMTFADRSFDFVYSMVVFQHLSEPPSVAAEMARVLVPGGIAYADFILFTSPTGSHDIRLLGGRSVDLPSWAHLRPQHEHLIQQSAYVNGLRLMEWRRIFETSMPGHELILIQPGREKLELEASRLRQQGELRDYSVEELVTTKVIVLWRKPRDERSSGLSE